MKRLVLSLLAMAVCGAGCAQSRPALSVYHRLDLPAHSDAPLLTADAYAELVNQLRTGDIVLGVKEDPVTAIVRLTTVEPTYFTHSATIEIIETMRAGRPQRQARIWHAIGDFSLLHLSPHVLGKVRGGVRTLSLEDFIRMYDALAIVRLPDQDKNRAMVESCRRLQAAGVEFDPFVDCMDRSSLCCTELTAVSIMEAGYDFVLAPAPRTHNATMSRLMTEWNATTPAIYMAGQFEHLPGAATVAVVSRYGRMETYLAMRDAVRLIHERIDAGEIEARDLGGFDHKRLGHYTSRMNLFLRGVEGLARASLTSDAAEIRRRNEIVYQTVFARGAPGQGGLTQGPAR